MNNIKNKIDNTQKNQQSTQDFLWSLENEQNELQVELSSLS